MWQGVKFSLRFNSLFLFLLIINNNFAYVTLHLSVKEPSQRLVVINAFDGCNIRVNNFRGLNIDFQTVKVPILLLRYLNYCNAFALFPFELRSSYPALKTQNISSCSNAAKFEEIKLPTDSLANSYVEQFFTDSFQLSSKNKMCEADIYLDPPTEEQFPEMYLENWGWESVFKHPSLINMDMTYQAQRWKYDYLNTVPLISLLICNLKENSIRHKNKNVKKWMAGVFHDFGMSRLSVSVLIWEFPSSSLKTLCAYCDPCDSFKTIPVYTKIIPTSRNELILKENLQMHPDPHSVRVVLLADIIQNDDLRQEGRRNRQAVLEHIQKYSVEDEHLSVYLLADIHLTSLLLPNSANVTFSEVYGNYLNKWKNVTIDACSSTKRINSHPVLRPAITRTQSRSRNSFQESRLVTFIDQFLFVSCHKELKHWTTQLTELVSPFDIYTWFLILTLCNLVSWVLKISQKSHKTIRKTNLFDGTFDMFWSILDQANIRLTSAGKTLKSLYFPGVFFVPITWLFLSTIYKGDNVTRLTAEPPLVHFDTVEMLEENCFNTYSRRFNLETVTNSHYFNISELVKLQIQHGSVTTHEPLPVVSELWYELMLQLRGWNNFGKSLIFLKNEISKQMWKYINNSAILPAYGQDYYEDIYFILNVHMNKCNKSEIILRRQSAVKLHRVLQQTGKPSFLGKDKILETFWGYDFYGHFPPNLVGRARYLFIAALDANASWFPPRMLCDDDLTRLYLF